MNNDYNSLQFLHAIIYNEVKYFPNPRFTRILLKRGVKSNTDHFFPIKFQRFQWTLMAVIQMGNARHAKLR